MRTSNATKNAKRPETRDEELARLIREQRADRCQDETGLKSTIAEEILAAPDLFADLREADGRPPKRRTPPKPRSMAGR
jgi:hypothetical protein